MLGLIAALGAWLVVSVATAAGIAARNVRRRRRSARYRPYDERRAA